MKTQGTTNTGTEVQVAQDRSDAELTSALVTAFQSAEADAKRFIYSTATLAAAIMDVHEAQVWKRTIDGETGALYSSATAYYKAIGSRFPLLHKLLRDELVAELYSADPNAIGIRELAALVHVDPAQITRSRKLALARAEAEAEAAAEAEAKRAAAEAAEAAAAEAAAEAAANGATEAEAAAAAEAVLKFAEAEAKRAEAEAAAAAKRAEAEAEATEQAKAIKSALSSLRNGIQQSSDQRQNMNAEQRAEAIKLAADALKEWRAFDALLAKAEAEAKPQPQPKPQPKPQPQRKRAEAAATA